MMSFSISYR